MPLRFRVWDKECQQLSIPVDLRDLLDLRPDYFDGNDKLIISQDTGLKDKNDKSIYTGDILECDCAGENIIGEVVYEEDCIGIRYGKLVGSIANFAELKSVDFCSTIIGNIWQNPELLEEQ